MACMFGKKRETSMPGPFRKGKSTSNIEFSFAKLVCSQINFASFWLFGSWKAIDYFQS